MGLYKNIVYWDYNMNFGDYVSWIRYPFMEYKHDPVFRVLDLKDNYQIDLQVVKSNYIAIGTIFYNQPREGLRRVKLFNIDTDLSYKKGV